MWTSSHFHEILAALCHLSIAIVSHHLSQQLHIVIYFFNGMHSLGDLLHSLLVLEEEKGYTWVLFLLLRRLENVKHGNPVIFSDFKETLNIILSRSLNAKILQLIWHPKQLQTLKYATT